MNQGEERSMEDKKKYQAYLIEPQLIMFVYKQLPTVEAELINEKTF